ncbi:acyl-CoA-binding domain-containing protein 5 [Sitophilus oryzae]|uniref:Acyl-CoA-binding domain-containing protein 5 n=1 Tax=Sitophilus oryzae TaxID=7048 RepID=A0A6J2X3M5_SITOR|nr:acyl-CoA-binding domain-containing protein 5 [Sitophilus oryzae]
MTTEEKFNAAVNVIRSLPKNGSYQPSNELMLRFYAYFKQATQGPCSGSRPAFWDIVGRAKYDAWKKLGDMSKNVAMAKYVDELHSIVETMSYSDKVANFLEAPTNELDSINFDDLELVAGDVLQRVRSSPNSPLASREGSPIKILASLSSSRSVSPNILSEESDDEYIDTQENPEPKRMIQEPPVISNGYAGHVSHRPTPQIVSTDISQEISRTVMCLKADLDRLSSQVKALEQSQKVKRKSMSKQWLIIMIIWPIIASYIVNKMMRKVN